MIVGRETATGNDTVGRGEKQKQPFQKIFLSLERREKPDDETQNNHNKMHNQHAGEY